ncbi:hypothetical protein CONCODRAFT_12934 [Conidiobolus coronatus NRRL 28638]|uniref:Uncharacterized protein n=1 Tax=Conidiobolus coronatus (strain ATCC 28846 / CBS 209.66 / NRRL 28638) TaxID=796925 RepID=A0A137NRR8_CONC2|nr:hypothetical protein CONCODRAFT_12934 [Conidiobolus coronatus NRRL 28638]|eukprot:KXN65466.1 hypothetical protein CONCODRAFT_12934 [Conidiobolus coronatus NRRL 28638]
MFDKYGFNNYLIFSIVLVFALGSNFHYYNEGLGIHFGKELLAFSIFSIGIYGNFIENEILKTSNQIQAVVIAIVTQFYVVTTLKYFASVANHIYFDYAYVVVVAISYLLPVKYLAVTERIFRFSFVYSVGITISRFIPPYILPHGNVASLILAIFGVFFNYLTYKRISILCSVYVFSLMILYGFAYFLRSMISHGWFSHSPLYYEGLEIAQLVIFFYASYQQLKSSNDGQILIGGSQAYSTFRNSSEPVSTESV